MIDLSYKEILSGMVIGLTIWNQVNVMNIDLSNIEIFKINFFSFVSILSYNHLIGSKKYKRLADKKNR